jgi:hypothetical protein
MAFFRQFPKIQYNTLLDGLTTEVTNIYRHVDVNDVLIDDASTYTYYEIQDGERPDIVSSRLYGTPDYYWTFFVANESLKSGLNSWPLEYNQFQEWIEQEYGAYSVMVFAPIQTQVLINGEVKIEHKNYFGGLDLTDVEIVDQNGNSAKISHYDIETLQLWIYDVSHPQFLDEKNRSFTLRYTGSDELKWYKNALDWASRNSPFAYDAFIRFTNLEEEGIELDTFAYYQLFYTRHFRNIIFESRTIIAQAKNAAKYYLDADLEEKSIISGYQAYNLEYDLSELEIEPYFRGRLEEFEDTYTSPFVKGNVTDVISNTYTQSFSSGSYVIYRPDPTSIGISILEYEEEQNFEKRKIRIIRPNVIETFVERYKDLIQS